MDSKLIYKSILLFFFFCLSSFVAVGQTTNQLDSLKKERYMPFAEYDSFLVDLSLYLEKGVRYNSDTIILDFESHWENNVIDEAQKKWIYTSTKRLHKNRINYRKHAALYYGCIMAFLDSGANLNNQFTRFLEIADTCLTSYSPKVTKNFFYKSRLFLEDGLIEKSKYTTIEVRGGTFNFAHSLATDGYVSDQMVVEINTEKTEKEDWFSSDEEKEDVAKENTSTEQESTSSWDSDDSSSDDDGWGSSDDSSSDWGDDSSEDYDWGSDDDNIDWGSDDGSTDWGDSWDGDDSSVQDYGQTSSSNSSDNTTFSEDCDVSNTEIRDYDPGITPLPPVEGPMLQISEADLIISTKFDTALLEHTVGTFLFKSDTIICQGGRFFWENVGFAKDSVWCELPHFTFDTRVALIEADHAEMYFAEHLDTIAIGAFTYKSGHFNKFPERAIYPQFISYNSNYKWINIPDNLELIGGFAVKGRKLSARSVSNASSTISVSNDSSTLFSLSTKKGIKINNHGENIQTKSSKLNIFYDANDTIAHPSVNTSLTTTDSTQSVYFRKTTDIYRFNPFTLSAQHLNVFADAVTWDLQKDSLDFRIIGGEKVIPLIVESQDFFKTGFVSRIQGFKKFQPLMVIVNYSRATRKKCFDASALADDLKINKEQFIESLQSMALEGLVEYNSYSQIVKLNPKAYQYYDRYFFASNERKRLAMTSRLNFENLSVNQENALIERDFDNINIPAIVPDDNTPNASLSLNDSSTLLLKKVVYFSISDSLNVYAQPDSAGIKVKDNREFTFGGKFTAGAYIFRGEEFTFNYDSFLIHLTKVDSINFIVRDTTTNKAKESPNPLVDTGGTLYINKPFNKSGLLDIDGYPSFNAKSDSSKGGRIYYDRPSVLNGVYDKRIVFELDTFTVDASEIHVDVSFTGLLNTGGIFPTFQDEVKMDPTTGIFALERETNHNEPWGSELGWPIYLNPRYINNKDSIRGKGNFDGKITLNHKGIRGEGTLEYLNSKFQSKDFIFYSDSLSTHGTQGVIESDIHPRVDMTTYDLMWYVNRDSMNFTGTHEEPFTIYNSNIKFSGNLALMPTKVFGRGLLETEESSNKSDNFRFQKEGYISRNSVFEINSSIEGSPSMLGQDVRVARNVIENKVLLKTEQGLYENSSLTFPFVNFQTSINSALWDINAKNITMSGENGTKGKFISNAPEQDSLTIEGDSASYDLATNKLQIFNVDKIKVSNLDIHPDTLNQTIRINKDAQIEHLENAQIILSRYTKFHTVYNANVELVSSKEVNATGTYLYKNELNEEKEINIDRIIAKEFINDELENTIQNRAYGVIEQEDPLLFVGGLDYFGKFGLVENKKVARFKDGNARLHIVGEDTQWFSYHSTNDDDEKDSTAHVNVTNKLISSLEKLPLQTGIYYDQNNGYLYNAFIERADGYRTDHRKLFDIEGRLVFESNDGTSNDGTYHVKPFTYYKALEMGEDEFFASIYGNWLSYTPKSNELEFHGRFDFLPIIEKNKIERIKSSVSGVAIHGIDEIKLNASFAIGPKLSSRVSATLLSDLRSNKEGVKRVISEDYEIDSLGDLNHQIVPLFTNDQFNNYLNGQDIIRLLGNYLVILDNELVWDNETYAFHSKGDKIKLLSAFGEDINTVIDGFIEIPKDETRGEAAPTDDVINVFLEGPTGTWYYIRQQQGELSILSSNSTLMEELKKQKDVTPITAEATFAFLESYYNNYHDGMEIPSRYESDLSKSLEPEPEDDFGNDFGGVDDDNSSSDDEEDGSMDSLPVEDEDDGDDF
ncbi:hypothetical protein [Flammeovirga kamogawensis]|uniref:Uncharacterized protein n=1 Tax=Flammeovirga kamogawensis TaxID=373891 RepID=A0ABX8GSI8_9BACT|nr:hypothetical protein [Flammeovirga kamogawensis]MBB6461482.1 hypothetical protein [Flammeovirga kamogawensis]QWG06374.1 hypothetical protein KM029_13670 [Flammeovirga kamogawensis]TRX68203.1 hypothetical protein EO216_08685 [Flammeovirga kamogawensis]